MLRTEIVRGLATLLGAIEESRVLDMIERVYRDLTRQSGEVRLPELLESYQKFLQTYNSRFTTAERQLMKTLDIGELADTEWWSTVLTASAAKSQDAASVIGHPLFRLRFVVDYLPNVLAILKRETDPDLSVMQAEIYAGGERPGHLMLILPEEGGKFSSPARISSAIESVALLYEAFAELNVQSTTDLVVKACDSGMDKVFEFQGLVPLIDKVKELLLDLWDNVIYFREKRFSERLELTARHLPILTEIGAQEESGTLQKERAELLRRKFTQGAHKFFETGASIPEMSRHATYVPRQLLSPKETLLLPARQAA